VIGDGNIPVGRLVGLDSYFALIGPSLFSAYGTFMLRQFFITLPRELEEAAEMDGCGLWRIFRHVTIPLSLPALATLGIFTFLGAWGSFMWPLVVTNKEFMRTLPVGLQAFQGQNATNWPLLMAASVLMLLPSVAIFFIGQRFMVSGLQVGAVKG
jgi:multiple sugar transport system permease protein